jgi:diaminopimelate decarboxylase
MFLVDMGGGWPGSDDNENLPEEDTTKKPSSTDSATAPKGEFAPPFHDFAEFVNKELARLFPEDPAQVPKFEITSEPGRFFATSSVTLACSLIDRREVYEDPFPEGTGPDQTDIPKV